MRRIFYCAFCSIAWLDLLAQPQNLTIWGRVLPEILTVAQLVNKFPAFYGTRRFITAFTSARHLSLSSVRAVKSMPPHPTTWRSILILSSYLRLGLQGGFFPSTLPTKTRYTPHMIIYTQSIMLWSWHTLIFFCGFLLAFLHVQYVSHKLNLLMLSSRLS